MGRAPAVATDGCRAARLASGALYIKTRTETPCVATVTCVARVSGGRPSAHPSRSLLAHPPPPPPKPGMVLAPSAKLTASRHHLLPVLTPPIGRGLTPTRVAPLLVVSPIPTPSPRLLPPNRECRGGRVGPSNGEVPTPARGSSTLSLCLAELLVQDRGSGWGRHNRTVRRIAQEGTSTHPTRKPLRRPAVKPGMSNTPPLCEGATSRRAPSGPCVGRSGSCH